MKTETRAVRRAHSLDRSLSCQSCGERRHHDQLIFCSDCSSIQCYAHSRYDGLKKDELAPFFFDPKKPTRVVKLRFGRCDACVNLKKLADFERLADLKSRTDRAMRSCIAKSKSAAQRLRGVTFADESSEHVGDESQAAARNPLLVACADGGVRLCHKVALEDRVGEPYFDLDVNAEEFVPQEEVVYDYPIYYQVDTQPFDPEIDGRDVYTAAEEPSDPLFPGEPIDSQEFDRAVGSVIYPEIDDEFFSSTESAFPGWLLDADAGEFMEQGAAFADYAEPFLPSPEIIEVSQAPAPFDFGQSCDQFWTFDQEEFVGGYYEVDRGTATLSCDALDFTPGQM